MLPQKIAFVDIETTGARPTYDRVLEIGIVRVEDNKVVDTYRSLFNPHTYISPFIENLTGITQADVEDAPTFWEEKERIVELLSDCIFVAHNVRFDYGFLRNEFKRHEVAYQSKHFCTVRLSRALYPQFRKHDLDSLIERFSIECQARHRAFDDAMVLWEFYQKIQQEFSQEQLDTALSIALKRPSRPINLPEEQLDSLPDTAGVYIFYDGGTTPLYIGKSINIRERVLSHFANDALSGTDMQLSQEVKRVEHIVTSGELSALFKESTLVKQMQPLYNRKLRQAHKLMVLKKVTTSNGYDTVSLETVDAITVEDIQHVIAVVRSKKQATEMMVNIAKEHNLCQKLLGIEKTKSGCFYYRLGWCKGACTGKETPISYNVRFLEAFMNTRIKPWPFDNPIIIQEENTIEQVKEVFIVDKWCVLGSFQSQDALEEWSPSEYIFDLDTYKILKSFLQSPRNLMKVSELNNSTHPVAASLSA